MRRHLGPLFGGAAAQADPEHPRAGPELVLRPLADGAGIGRPRAAGTTSAVRLAHLPMGFGVSAPAAAASVSAAFFLCVSQPERACVLSSAPTLCVGTRTASGCCVPAGATDADPIPHLAHRLQHRRDGITLRRSQPIRLLLGIGFCSCADPSIDRPVSMVFELWQHRLRWPSRRTGSVTADRR